MLIQFSIANYRSFKAEQTLSMVAGTGRGLEETLADVGDKLRLSKVAAVYGANASGKSNLISAFRSMKRFVVESATKLNLGDEIECAMPFKLDQTTLDEPSEFEIVVALPDGIYTYGFTATSQRVQEEWLNHRPYGGKLSRWLQRHWDPSTKRMTWILRGPLEQDTKLLIEKTRDNGLLLSRAAEFNVEGVQALFLWFRRSFGYFDLSLPPQYLLQFTAHRMNANPTFRERILELMQHADFGISGLLVSEGAPRDLDTQAISELRKLIGDERSPIFSVSTIHRNASDESEIQFRLEEESNGTQRFLALAGLILLALDEGDLLVIDELDCSMHPHLARKIVELFQSTRSNPKNAQIVFATHDSSMMDPRLFRRDQIWITEKKTDGSTELFSLFDIAEKPRKNTAFERNYLAGRYGGVPKFGPMLEDVEVP